MDPSTMTFEEFLFNGRWHIIGAVLFLVFFAVFVQEAVKEIRAWHASRRQSPGGIALGPHFHDDLLGHTMADGGQPLTDSDGNTAEHDER